ncbi:hypothetical protein AAMO2058_001054500 [Amorphochlora amoebiformis]
MDAKVRQFVELTGSSEQHARFFLESNNWDVQSSLNSFLENGGGGGEGTALEEKGEDIPPPQPQVTERLFGPVRGRRRGMMRPRTQTANSLPWSSNKRLAAMYKPPTEMNYSGPIEEAADHAAGRAHWLLINIQDDQEFKCHMLNRDIWKDPGVSSIIKDSFVFWQRDKADDQGGQFCAFYDINDFPHVSIVHPKSRKIIKSWTPREAVLFNAGCFAKSLELFLEKQAESGTDPSARPAKRRKVESSAKPLERQETEKAMLDRAIRESLEDVSNVPDAKISSAASGRDPIPRDQKEVPERHESSKSRPGKSHIKVIPEPPAGPNTTQLQIRLPSSFDGKRIRRRFCKSATVKSVVEFVWNHMVRLEASKLDGMQKGKQLPFPPLFSTYITWH